MPNPPQAPKPQEGDPSLLNQLSPENGDFQTSPETPQVPSPENLDVAQADVVREKLVSESAGLGANQTSSTQTPVQAGVYSQTNTALASMGAMTPEDQINHLVDVAHKSGLDHAYKMALDTKNAYIIDRFHDELVNRVLHNKQQSM